MRLYRTAAVAVVVAAGVVAFTPAAQAAPNVSCHRVHQQSGPNYGILNGNNIDLPVDVGVNVTDVALGLLGGFAGAGGGNHNVTVSCGNYN
jgi:hypothetical protein